LRDVLSLPFQKTMKHMTFALDFSENSMTIFASKQASKLTVCRLVIARSASDAAIHAAVQRAGRTGRYKALGTGSAARPPRDFLHGKCGAARFVLGERVFLRAPKKSWECDTTCLRGALSCVHGSEASKNQRQPFRAVGQIPLGRGFFPLPNGYGRNSGLRTASKGGVSNRSWFYDEPRRKAP
jgi:hypothetical protein